MESQLIKPTVSTRRREVTRRRVRSALLLAAAVLLAAASSGCSDADGPEGTYVHDEEGTIVLDDDGSATWEQEGDNEPFEFEWTADGESIDLLIDGEVEGTARIDNGDLVLPPDMISGDEDVTFERQ